jgi:hypothetical protein
MVREIAGGYALARRQARLQIAFWGTFSPENLRDELRSQAAARGAPVRDIMVSGPFDWRTLVGELTPTGWCSCVLMNTRNRNNCVGLPNRLFESWANRVPVLANEGTEVARVVREVGGGFVIPEPVPEAISEVFKELANRPEVVVSKGEAGYQAVTQTYSWSAAFANLLEFYAQLGVRAGDFLSETKCVRRAG